MKDLNVLPPKFQTWSEFYRDVCKSMASHISNDEQTDDLKIEYAAYSHPESAGSKYCTTLGFIKARVFDEVREAIAQNASVTYDYVSDDFAYDAVRFVESIERMILIK